jgi:hypothetical protein
MKLGTHLSRNRKIRIVVFVVILIVFWAIQAAIDKLAGISIIGVVLFLGIELVAWISLNIFLDSNRGKRR